MSRGEHSRFEIWTAAQHPYKHTLDDFGYTNPGLPTGTTSLQGAVDYLFAVLYPQSKPAVDTTADLPLVGNTINDMRVVHDDGDGKAASYRWEQREGEAVASWHKIYDVDFGTDSILQAWQIKTQDVYVSRFGYDDRDAAGDVIVGALAGQSIFGGRAANSNLNLFANSGDGTGPATGFIQLGDQIRPTIDVTWNLGTSDHRFLKLWVQTATLGTLTLGSGSIVDTGGTVSFGSNVVTTTGNGHFADITISTGSIVASGGSISFSSNALTTTGLVTANAVSATGAVSTFKTGTTVGTLTLANGSITDSSHAISFGDNALTTTGASAADTFIGTTYVQGGNLRLASQTLSSQNANGNINISPNGTGIVNVTKSMTTLGIAATGTVSATAMSPGNLTLSSNDLASSNSNGNINLTPNGTGVVTVSSILRPSASGFALGATGQLWGTIYTNTGLSDGTNAVSIATLLSLRDINTGASSGMALFYNGSEWLPSLPDAEITHNSLSGLTSGDAGHTQFVMLAGRSGGQTIQGGTGASENLTLESTSNGTKGSIKLKDATIAFTDATFSGTWSGTDIGATSNRFRHIYTAGEFFGFRAENVGSLPSASSQRVGRLVFLTTDSHLYADTGTALVKVGDTNRFQTDTVWNGTDVTKSVSVTTAPMDARQAVWRLSDNSNNYEQVYASITATAALTVVITTNVPLPAGSYRLVGLE